MIMCYTREQGKQRYIAKSSRLARSKQGSHLDVMNYIEFGLVPGRHFDIIASAQAVDTFPLLKASLTSLANAFFLFECFDKLVFDGQRDDALWEFLLQALRTGVVDRPAFMATLGYHHSTPLADLNPAYFTSLRFLATLER